MKDRSYRGIFGDGFERQLGKLEYKMPEYDETPMSRTERTKPGGSR